MIANWQVDEPSSVCIAKLQHWQKMTLLSRQSLLEHKPTEASSQSSRHSYIPEHDKQARLKGSNNLEEVATIQAECFM